MPRFPTRRIAFATRPDYALLGVLAQRAHGTPFVVACHGIETQEAKANAVQRSWLPRLNQARAVFGVWHHVAEELVEMGLTQTPTVQTPAVDLERFPGQ